MSMAAARRALTPLLAAVAVASCDGATQPEVRLAAVGRAERGLSVRIALVRQGDTAALIGAAITLSPSDAATLRGDSLVELLRAGDLTVTARLADGTTLQTNLSVATPPLIAFDMLVDGNRDIYVAALDGADVTRLTTDPADDADPTVAGGRVVFVSYRSGRGELYARTTTPGGAETRITTSASGATEPALSSDGSRIAFVVDDGSAAKVWTSDANGAGTARLTSAFGFAGSAEFSPTWSPDRDRVAFTATALGAADLFSATLGTSAMDTLLKAATIARPRVEPAWSSDGRLAFVGAEHPAQVFVRTGTSVAVVTKCAVDCGQPAWLDDGRIVFTMFSLGGTRLAWVDPAEGTALHLVPLSPATVQRAAAVR